MELQAMYQVCRVSIRPKPKSEPPIKPKRRALRIYLELHILASLGLREAELLGQKEKDAICRCSMCNYYRPLAIDEQRTGSLSESRIEALKSELGTKKQATILPEHERVPLPGLQVAHIDFKTRSVTIYGKGWARADPKKRSPPRILPLEDKETIDLLKTYIKARKLTGTDNILPYTQLSPRQLQRDVKEVARLASVAGWEFVTPHKLRHYYATQVSNPKMGGSLKIAQDLLGHASPATTLRYMHSSEDERREAVRKVFDRTTPEGQAT
jgi:hypothetical protein